MNKKLIVGAVAVGTLAITAGSALALSSDDTPTTPAARITTSTSGFTSISGDTSPPMSDTSTFTETPAPAPGALSADDAVRIVVGRWGGTAHEVEQEWEHGRFEWKVEITAADGNTYDVRVDAETGAVTRVDQDGHRGGDDH